MHVSVTSTVMMGLILFIFNVIWSINILTQNSLKELENKVDLIIYVSDEISLYDINDMRNSIDSLPYVNEVTYTSKEEALQDFLAKYPDKENLFTSYGLNNPLPASFKIISKEPNDHQEVVNYLQTSAYAPYLLEVESADENKIIVERLIKMRDFTKTLALGVILAFSIGSLLMLMNSIHMSIFTRKKEIQIMQMVGAHPNMIRLPFIFEGILYSVLAVCFGFALFTIFTISTGLQTLVKFNGITEALIFLGAEFFISIAIGILASILAINFYLKKTFFLDSWTE